MMYKIKFTTELLTYGHLLDVMILILS